MKGNKELKNIEVNIEEVLNKGEIETQAKSTGFVQRVSQLNGVSFLYLNIESVGSNGLSSLTEQCMILSKRFGIEISNQGLDDRYSEKAVSFVDKILSEMLRVRLGLDKLLNLGGLGVFQGIYVRDATSSQLPECFAELFKGSGGSASSSGVKVELSYNLTGTEINLDFRNGASSDSTSKDAEIQQGSLNLQDLGYFKISRFLTIINANAYFISRYKHNTNIYLEAGSSTKAEKSQERPITLKELTKGMEVNEVRSKEVYIGMQERLPVRLVMQKVPKNVSDKRKRKLREDAQKKGIQLAKSV
jgi:hypothetical protein